MTTAEKLLREATRRGCRLYSAAGSRLGFECPGGLPLDLERALIREKFDMLELLKELRNTAGQIFSEGAEWNNCTPQQARFAADRLALNPLDPLCNAARKRLAALMQTQNERR